MALLTHYSEFLNKKPEFTSLTFEKKHLEVDTHLDYFFQVWLNKYKKPSLLPGPADTQVKMLAGESAMRSW